MTLLNILQQVVKIRRELINRVSAKRLPQINSQIVYLIGKIKTKNTPLLNIAREFLQNIDLADQKFLALTEKPKFPIKFSQIASRCLDMINQQSYQQAFEYLTQTKDKYQQLDNKKYIWSESNWQKFNLVKLLSKKSYLENLIQNHKTITRQNSFQKVYFKAQNILWQKTNYAGKKSMTINPLVGVLEPDLFDIWWNNVKTNQPDKSIWFYQEFLNIFKKSSQPLTFTHKLSGIFINPNLVVSKVWAKWFDDKKQPPHSSWSIGYNFRKLASYNFPKDQINFSLIFDMPKIDIELINFIAYHELLHRRIGVKIYVNKTVAHSKLFKQLESSYPDYKKLTKKLDEFLKTGRV